MHAKDKFHCDSCNYSRMSKNMLQKPELSQNALKIECENLKCLLRRKQNGNPMWKKSTAHSHQKVFAMSA